MGHWTTTVSVPRLLALTLLLTVVPPLGTVEAVAIPRTTSTVVDGLPADPDADPDVGVDDPAVAAHADEHGDGEPEVLSRQVVPEMAFSMVGFEVPASVDAVEVRTSVDGDTWSAWYLSEVMDPDEAPDADSDEAAAPRARARVTAPVWTGEARGLQIRVAGADPEDVEVTLIDSLGLSGQDVEHRFVPTGASAEAQSVSRTDLLKPDIVTREQWGAEPYKGTPSTASDVYMGVIHHTASGNDYAEWEGPSLVRGFQRYHQVARGWSDIGYNLLVDKYGNVYEGRAGGLENAVIGAHAAGFNTGSFGVSVIGNLDGRWPTGETVDALVDVIAWKAAVHDFDPDGTTWMYGEDGYEGYSGDGIERPRVLGHGDVGDTSCPGWVRYHFDEIRRRAAAKSYPFRDITTRSPHRWPIAHLYFDDVADGCADGRYCPDVDITRADAAMMIAKALGIAPVAGQRFDDVEPSDEASGYINAMVDRGIVDGYPDGTFQPDRPIKRNQMAKVVSIAMGLEPVWGDHFADVPWGAPHDGWVYALARTGLTKGCDEGLYCATDLTRRDQMASFVDRMRRY